MKLNAGRNEVVKLIGDGLGGASFSHVAFGTGTTAPAATDTQLGAETERVAATETQETVSVTNDTARFTAFFTMAADRAWREYGVVNAATNGVFLNRSLLASTLRLRVGDKVKVVIDFLLAAVLDTPAVGGGTTTVATTNAAIAILTGRMTGIDTSTRFKMVVLGKSQTAATVNQTALVTEIVSGDSVGLHRAAATNIVVSNPTTGVLEVRSRYTTTADFYSSTGVGECAILSDLSSGGTMLARYVFKDLVKFLSGNVWEPRFQVEVLS